MKKVLLTLLVIVLLAGALGVTGLTAYRYGYANGLSNNTTAPALGFGKGFGWDQMPMHQFGFGMHDGFGRGFDNRMTGRGGMGHGGFGLFSIFGLLTRLAILALIAWLVYKFVNGWRISIAPPAMVAASPTGAPGPETKNETE